MLTEPLFKSWLESKKTNEVVGTIGEPSSCPIATYLKENGAFGISISDGAIYSKDGDYFEKHADWIDNFINNIDGLVVIPHKDREEIYRTSDHGQRGSPKVDAATCLKTLGLPEA